MTAFQRSSSKSSTAAVCWIPALLTENIHGAERLDRLADHGSDLFGFRQIGAVEHDAHPELLRQRDLKLFDLARIAESVQHHVRAVGRERACDPEADAAGRAGDDCRFSLEHFLLLSIQPPSTRRVWRAIMSSSLVGITHAPVGLVAVLMRGPPLAFAASSSSTPSQRRVCGTRARTIDALSRRSPPVKTMRVEAAQRRGERSQLAADAIDEQIASGLRARVVARRAACACRSRCPTRRAGPTRCRSASRSPARPSPSSMR